MFYCYSTNSILLRQEMKVFLKILSNFTTVLDGKACNWHQLIPRCMQRARPVNARHGMHSDKGAKKI